MPNQEKQLEETHKKEESIINEYAKIVKELTQKRD